MFFLQKTPVIVQNILLLIGIIWIISYGFSNLVRFYQVMLPFFIGFLLVSIGLSLQKIDFSTFFPILENGFLPLIKGTIVYCGFLQGIEVILFTYPFFSKGNKKSLYKNALIGVGLINFLALTQILISVGGLGLHCVRELLWPNFTVLQLIEIPGLIGERFDLLFTFAWFISLFCAGILFYYLAAYGIIVAFKIKNKKFIILLVGVFTMMFSYIIPNYAWSTLIWQIINYITIVFIFLIPLLTLLLALFRKQGRPSHD
jgi:spore germination protein (amino acid permease)